MILPIKLGDLVHRIDGRDPGEPITWFLRRIEEDLGKVSIEDLAALCGTSGLGVDDLIYEIAARKLGQDREDVVLMEQEEKQTVESTKSHQ